MSHVTASGCLQTEIPASVFTHSRPGLTDTRASFLRQIRMVSCLKFFRWLLEVLGMVLKVFHDLMPGSRSRPHLPVRPVPDLEDASLLCPSRALHTCRFARSAAEPLGLLWEASPPLGMSEGPLSAEGPTHWHLVCAFRHSHVSAEPLFRARHCSRCTAHN